MAAAAVALTIVVASPTLHAQGTAPPVGPPVISVIKPSWLPDETMIVRGTGWPEGTVSVQICGNNGVNGTPDCDMPSSRTFGVGSWGVFGVKLTVVAPPAPCPCVILARSTRSEAVAVTPIVIAGHPVSDNAPTRPPSDDGTSISLSMTITNQRSWRDFLGFGPRRHVQLTLTNTGTKETGTGTIDIAVGKDSPPTGFGATESFASIPPNESVTIDADLTLEAFAYGDYWIQADVRAIRANATTAQQTSTFPSGLLALIVGVIILIDAFIVWRVFRRRRTPPPPAASPIASFPPPVAPLPAPTFVDQDEQLAAWMASQGVDESVVDAIRRGDHRKPREFAESGSVTHSG